MLPPLESVEPPHAAARHRRGSHQQVDFKRVDLLSPELLRSDLGFNEDGKNHHKGRTPNRVGRPNLTVAVTANSQLFGEKKHPVHSAAAQVRTTLGPRRGGHAPTGRKEERKNNKNNGIP